MNRNDSKRTRGLAGAFAALIALMSAPAATQATDWILSDTPLFLGTAVPANILLLIDDSGSMEFEVMTKDSRRENAFLTNQPDGRHLADAGNITHQIDYIDVVKNIDGTTTTFIYYCDPTLKGVPGYFYGVEFSTNVYNAGKCIIAADNAWRFRNSQFNLVYFDPNKDYFPWAGTDQSGNPFPDADLTNAHSRPWYTNQAQYDTIDLTADAGFLENQKRPAQAGGFKFYTWDDTDGDGNFDNTDKIVEYSIGTLTDAEAEQFGGRTAAQIQQNFANWFVYHRARHLLAKAAFGDLIMGMNNLRMGVATIHNNNVVNTSVQMMDNTPTGIANKKILMDNLYRFTPGGNTPLRTSYKNVGLYLSGLTNNLFGNNEIAPLPPSEGGECQQNFALILTDGSYNDDKEYTDTVKPQVHNADGDGSSAWDGKSYADDYNMTLADIAMYYYENDIIPQVANKVPVSPPLDYNSAQHVVTYAISFGVTGTLDSMPPDPDVAFPWPDPIDLTDPLVGKYRIDDLRHAAYNGRGEFLSAANPDELIAALKHMIDSIQARTTASAALSFNTTTVRTDTLVFQARYNTGDWTGDLNLVPFKDIGQTVIEVRNAGYMLTSRLDPGHIKPTERTIITTDEKGNAYPFRWTNINATQQSILRTQYALDWIRGDQVCEQDNGISLEVDSVNGCPLALTDANLPFRERSRVLGDIVNSASIHVGPPSRYYTDAGYEDFKLKYADRKRVVYVGSNDGMLHGFDATMNTDGTFTATTGVEVLAFLPDRVYPDITEQVLPTYTHRYTMDGSPGIGDVNLGDDTYPNWQTILVTGMRTGGQAYFGLNVTDPLIYKESNADKIFMWEFADSHDADMGHSFAVPRVAKLNNGQYAAIMANGINSTVPDAFPGSGEVVLYINNIADGSIITALRTKGYSATSNSMSNGMTGMTPIDVDGDGDIDHVYGTDIAGQLWRFDLIGDTISKWTVGFNGMPLFAATSPEGNQQPITTSPAVAAHPSGIGYMVFFGTGKYFEDADNKTVGVDTMSFYGIWDKYPAGTDISLFNTLTRKDLLQQFILEELYYGLTRVTTDYALDWNTQSGWFLDLIDPVSLGNEGERVVTDPVYRNGRVLFSTMIPAGDVCQFGGTGWLMNLGAFDGKRSVIPVFDVNNDGIFNDGDLLTMSDGSMVAISGAKSTHGIPSAPALIQGESGTYDNLLMNFSNGSLGGTGTFTTDVAAPVDETTLEFDTSLQVPPSNTLENSGESQIINIMTPTGRLIWQRER